MPLFDDPSSWWLGRIHWTMIRDRLTSKGNMLPRGFIGAASTTSFPVTLDGTSPPNLRTAGQAAGCVTFHVDDGETRRVTIRAYPVCQLDTSAAAGTVGTYSAQIGTWAGTTPGTAATATLVGAGYRNSTTVPGTNGRVSLNVEACPTFGPGDWTVGAIVQRVTGTTSDQCTAVTVFVYDSGAA